MDLDTIQEMFSEMGLGSLEQREELVRKLSINLIDTSGSDNKNIKTCNNTLKVENYA